jgi:hypothetical protein
MMVRLVLCGVRVCRQAVTYRDRDREREREREREITTRRERKEEHRT